jgi:nitric oxide dioxygenase
VILWWIAKKKKAALLRPFTSSPKMAAPLPSYMAGQYITVRMPTKDSSTTMRNYSLSDKPGSGLFPHQREA